MPLMRGEDINIGMAVEDPLNRGVHVPSTAWLAGRTPTGINVEVVKAMIKETRGSGIASQGSEVVQRAASGNLEFNMKSETIGYILKSLLGKCTTTPGAVNSHLFEVLIGNPQFPTLSFQMAQSGNQDYDYPGGMVRTLEIRTPVDDLVNATIDMGANDEVESGGTLTADPSPTDYFFRPYEVTIKMADDVASLAGADELMVKEFDISIKNNGRKQQHIGSITPTDQIANLIEATGNITIDYQDSDFHDFYKEGVYKAIQITFSRDDIDLGGGVHPSLTITLAKVSFETNSPDRPMDDIVRDSLEFTAHFSEDDNEAIRAVLRNTVDYDFVEES